MRIRFLIIPLIGLAAAGCSSSSGPAATGQPTAPAAATSAAPSTPAAAAATTPSSTASADAFYATMNADGFVLGGTPAYLIDADGSAVCGNLQNQSMADEVSYEESVDENAATGMTSDKDILEFIAAAVTDLCPQYASELPKG
jgi:Protein of unknown function (DUF732)